MARGSHPCQHTTFFIRKEGLRIPSNVQVAPKTSRTGVIASAEDCLSQPHSAPSDQGKRRKETVGENSLEIRKGGLRVRRGRGGGLRPSFPDKGVQGSRWKRKLRQIRTWW